MQEFETTVLSTYSRHRPRIWLRYVDDTFVILHEEESVSFFGHINSLDTHISFTQETCKDEYLAFLDVEVHVDSDGTLSTSVYRKPTHTDQYLNCQSHHPLVHKLAVIRTLFHRPDTIVHSPPEVGKEKTNIKNAQAGCGDPDWAFSEADRHPETTKQEHTENPRKNKLQLTVGVFHLTKALSGHASKPTVSTHHRGGITGPRKDKGIKVPAPREGELGFPSELEAEEVTEITLWKISECITHEQFTQFALSLGCTASSIINRQSEMDKGVSVAEVAFKVLHAWEQNQMKGQARFLYNILVKKLEIGRDLFISMFKKENFLRSKSSRSMTELQLWDVAENAPIDMYIPIGLRFGLTYNSLQSTREGTKTTVALFRNLVRWQQELSSNVDQPETLARVLEACKLKKLAHNVRCNHLGVINAGKTMVIVPPQPPRKANPAEQRDVSLLVSHSNPDVQNVAEGNLKRLLLPTPDNLKTQGIAVGESFVAKLSGIVKLRKLYADLVRAIQNAVGKEAMYQLQEMSLDSIHLSLKVYSDEGYTLLIDDIQSGLIGRQLGDALISLEARKGLPDSISFKVSLEEKGWQGATQVTHPLFQQKGSDVNAWRIPSLIIDDIGSSNGQRKEEPQVSGKMPPGVLPNIASGFAVDSLNHESKSSKSKAKGAQELYNVRQTMVTADVATTRERKGARHDTTEEDLSLYAQLRSRRDPEVWRFELSRESFMRW
ncbi:uncharacterized protein [Diadema setosum]|uniref:uncharacterized protein n=1 Tax=Diadema setosum TaxID=31175 RepID=UPI003B3A1AE1